MSILSDRIQRDLANKLAGWDSLVSNPQTSKAVTINGVYQRDYVESAEISGYTPMFTCRTLDVANAGLAAGDVVEVTSDLHSLSKKKFTVTKPEDTGAITVVFLHTA